jgi:hypothetical protein
VTSKHRPAFDVVAYDKAVVAKVGALRGKERASYEAAKANLEAQGCRQAGYRFLAEDGGPSQYCCKHLHGLLRLVTEFEANDVIVVAIGHHDGDFYRDLAGKLGTSAVGQRRANKPACCGPNGWAGNPDEEQRTGSE